MTTVDTMFAQMLSYPFVLFPGSLTGVWSAGPARTLASGVRYLDQDRYKAATMDAHDADVWRGRVV